MNDNNNALSSAEAVNDDVSVYYISAPILPRTSTANSLVELQYSMEWLNQAVNSTVDVVIEKNSDVRMASTSAAISYSSTIEATTITDPSAAYNDDDYLNTLSDDEYIDFVANFLRPTLIEMVFVAVFLCLMTVGIAGNCLVVYVVSRNKSMWSSMNIFLTNLAVSDLLVLIFCLPPTVINDITKTFWFSSASCKAILFFQNVSVYVSVLTLMCIAVERWKAISNPLAIPFWRTSHVVFIIWIISALLSLPEPFTLRIYPADYARKNLSTKWGTRCMESWSMEFQQKYQLTQTIVLFITPLLIISGFCVHMSLILRRKALQISSRQLRDRQRAIKMLIMVVLIFAISYLPVHLHNIATAFHIDPSTEPSLTAIALRKFIPRFMSYSSSCLNPILYNFMSEKFRKEFRRACCFGSALMPSRERYYYNSGGYISKDHLSSSSRLPYAVVNGGGSNGSPVNGLSDSPTLLSASGGISGGIGGMKHLTRYNSTGNTNFLI